MTKWRPNDTAIASSSHGFFHGGICSSEPSSESAFRALNISIVTRTESDIVDAVSFPLPVMYLHGSLDRSSPPFFAHVVKLGLYTP